MSTSTWVQPLKQADQILEQLISHYKFDETKYNHRIFKFLDKMKQNNSKNTDLYGLLCKQYPNENITHFINDYHQFVANLDNDKFYLTHTNDCSMDHCIYLKQYYSDKIIHHDSENSMIIRQKLVILHVLIYHLLHIGHRSMMDNEHEHEQRFINMRERLKQKRKKINKLRNDPSDQKQQKSKFVTEIMPTQLQNNKNTKHSFLEYSFGYNFFYHRFYEKNEHRNQVIHRGSKSTNKKFEDANNFRDAPKAYSFKDWFIYPKYECIKEEVLVNNYLTLEQFKKEMKQALIYINSWHAKTLTANAYFEIFYGIKKGSRISSNHMLSVLLYTNYNILPYEFGKTFRKIAANETDEALKARHSEFAHFGKYMKETVDCFGDDSEELRGKRTVYHGIDQMALFSGMFVYFYGPTSTTTELEVAVSFASHKGSIIEIQTNKYTMLNNFDCRSWSDFPSESEKLYISMKFFMEIVDLVEVQTAMYYRKWISALKIFERMLTGGQILFEPITETDINKIESLVKSVVNNYYKSENINIISNIPKYIAASFDHIRNNTKNINIDIYKFSVDTWVSDTNKLLFCGKPLKHIYFDEKGDIKWNVINCLFPSLSRIHIRRIENYTWTNSIGLTDGLLLDILGFLNNSIDCIRIYSPRNNLDSMNVFKLKYVEKYERIGYKINIVQNHKGSGYMKNHCDIFEMKQFET